MVKMILEHHLELLTQLMAQNLQNTFCSRKELVLGKQHGCERIVSKFVLILNLTAAHDGSDVITREKGVLCGNLSMLYDVNCQDMTLSYMTFH